MNSRRPGPLILLALTCIASAARAQSPAVHLYTDDASRDQSEVEGIVCDNLRGMAAAQRDHLEVRVSGAPADAPITFDPPANLDAPRATDGRVVPFDAGSAGTLAADGARILYYPPDEFNPVQAPASSGQVVNCRERRVKITLTVTGSGGPVRCERTILLRRPPVVLIHGVNSSARMWTRPSECGYALAAALRDRGFELDYVDHGDPPAVKGRKATPDGLSFAGNGPVEHAAELVARKIAERLDDVRHGSPALAIRRVDLVAHSYGGVIARWYLRMANGETPDDSRSWYRYADHFPEGPRIYHIAPSFFAAPPYHSGLPDACVRKLITLGTPWRGTPIANYINQTRALDDQLRLRSAPYFNSHAIHIGTVLSRLRGLGSDHRVETLAPSMEVCAVESPWLQFLDNRTEGGRQAPFLDGVAYGSIAGDNTAFLSETLINGNGFHDWRDLGVDLFGLIDTLQSPSRFPYLALDSHDGSDINYSDGLIPVWSALTPGGDTVPANHNGILLNDRAIQDVLCWLSSAALPLGAELNGKWGQPVASRLVAEDGAAKTWTFRPGAMAPWPQSEIYGKFHGTARIRPEVTADIGPVCTPSTRHGATFTWRTLLEMDGYVTVYEYRMVDFARWDLVEVATVPTECVGKDHVATVRGLHGTGFYYYRVISDFADPFNGVLELQSPLKQFSPGP